MSIVRVRKRENPFVQIDRRVFEDHSLSWKAKGILGYLLSKPDNWKIYIADLAKKAKDGRDSVRTGLKELEERGYVQKVRMRTENGKFAGWEYQVFETPINPEVATYGKTEIGKSDFGKSDFGESDTSNNYLSNKEISNKEIMDDDMDKPNPVAEYEKAFGHFPPHALISEFNEWIEKSQFVEPEKIICEVIKRAKLRMPRNPASYISRILNNLHYLGLFTLEAVREYNEKFDQQTKRRTGKAKVSEIDWEAL